jgi:hypothetical protein
MSGRISFEQVNRAALPVLPSLLARWLPGGRIAGDEYVRVGFRRRAGDEPWVYMLLPEQWRSEVAKGFDAPALARAMIDRKLMIPGGDGKAAKPVKVPGHGTMRLYVLAPGIIGDAAGSDAG